MGILIGMDEAGYGPNLGPLVVAATAWRVAEDSAPGAHDRRRHHPEARPSATRCDAHLHPKDEVGVSARSEPLALDEGALVSDDTAGGVAMVAPRPSERLAALSEIDLYRLLRPAVARAAHEKRIAIADSKALYRPGLGLRHLERGLHAVLGAMGCRASCWSEMISLCGGDPGGQLKRLCWHDGFDCPLPVDATSEELSRLGVRFGRACDKVGVRPVAIVARLVFPAEFNELVEQYGTKGAALSHVTVGLLREITERLRGESEPARPAPCPASDGAIFAQGATGAIPPYARGVGASGPVYAVCDKHGGRNFYAGLLQHHFSEYWIEPVFEGAAESRYEWGPSEARVAVSFRTRGETFLPTALASMVAKYVRELAMRAFNEFWCAQVSGLRPTAGYPVDARRFKQAISAKQRELGIDDHILWRRR